MAWTEKARAAAIQARRMKKKYVVMAMHKADKKPHDIPGLKKSTQSMIQAQRARAYQTLVAARNKIKAASASREGAAFGKMRDALAAQLRSSRPKRAAKAPPARYNPQTAYVSRATPALRALWARNSQSQYRDSIGGDSSNYRFTPW